jgi:hypothetical protein
MEGMTSGSTVTFTYPNFALIFPGYSHLETYVACPEPLSVPISADGVLSFQLTCLGSTIINPDEFNRLLTDQTITVTYDRIYTLSKQ